MENDAIKHPPSPLELWGGFECTIARIGDSYRDQCAETGHRMRLDDLDAAASLGLARLRYPVLWEAVAPRSPENCDWRWTDERLGRIRALGMAPIAGLVHHGSGPRHTSLLDPAFPSLLARYALQVARRYPWIEDYTPVNEPLTTARFSGLYGHWYPHGCDEAMFLKALFHQTQGIAAAMAALRSVNPRARLVQTEDLGRVFSSPRLAYQAEYENERRWLSFDLITGRVDARHSWFRRFMHAGIPERQLVELAEQPCPPDIIGINHYLTSDRFLDDDITGYPSDQVGGNGRDTYADVAAVRAHIPERALGFGPRLREAWDRYRLPVALTEVHNGSTREQQLRWLRDAWTAAHTLRDSGVDVRGFTIWSLAGAVDWSSLLTQQRNHYEPGAFDVRDGRLRRTALAHAVSALAKNGRLDHPVAGCPGWWHCADRYHRPLSSPAIARTTQANPILITGMTGTLGQAFARICEERGLAHVLLSRQDLDIADPDMIRAALGRFSPWAVINTAGYVRVAQAASEPDRCMRENATGPALLADITRTRSIPLVTFSSDLVFDGSHGRPYVESDAPSPTCVYGQSKMQAEQSVLAASDRAMIVRTSAFFGPWDRYNFAHSVIDRLAQGGTFEADDSTVVSPTYVPHLVHEVLDLLIDDAPGVWHVANAGQISWHAFARSVARAAGLDETRVQPLSSGETRVTALKSERGIALPAMDDAVAAWWRQRAV